MRKGVSEEMDEYQTWHLNEAPKEFYCTNIDQLEYMFVDGIQIPVAIIERTTCWPNSEPLFFERVIQRYFVDPGTQGPMANRVADALHCKAFIVAHTLKMDQFHIYDMQYGADGKWWDEVFDRARYVKFQWWLRRK